MTIRGERAITRLFRVPATGHWETADALDAGIAMRELDNNSSHLCEESVRHLAMDAPGDLYTFTDTDWVSGEAIQSHDVNVPSLGDIQHAWEGLAWDNRSAYRYGPFVLVPDVGNRPVAARPRAVRVVVHLSIAAGLTVAGASAVMTRGSGADEILSGRSLVAVESAGLGAGVQTLRFDLAPDDRMLVDNAYRADRVLTSASIGTTSSTLRQYWLWVGFVLTDSGIVPAAEILSVSAYEVR